MTPGMLLFLGQLGCCTCSVLDIRMTLMNPNSVGLSHKITIRSQLSYYEDDVVVIHG